MLPWGLLHKYKGTFASPERIRLLARPNDSVIEPARVFGISPETGVFSVTRGVCSPAHEAYAKGVRAYSREQVNRKEYVEVPADLNSDDCAYTATF